MTKINTLNDRDRIEWLDNLRTFMIFLVIVLHASIIYEKTNMGATWWIITDPGKNDLPGLLFLILDIFVMATIFFISGYLAPISLQKKNKWQFLKTKMKRLLIPWFIAVLTLVPVYKVIFLFARNLPQENWTTYFHWTNGIWSQNWLWFLPVLFLFNVIYLVLTSINRKLILINTKILILLIFLMCLIYSCIMDYFKLQGWTKTILIDFQNERLFIYFMVFLFGSLCNQLAIFKSAVINQKWNIIIHCTGWIPLFFYVFFLVKNLIYPDKYFFTRIGDIIVFRLNFLLSLVYLIYTVVTVFWIYLPELGKIGRELNKNSYAVYIIHVIILGLLALLFQKTSVPFLLKFLMVSIFTFLFCNFFLSGFRIGIKNITS